MATEASFAMRKAVVIAMVRVWQAMRGERTVCVDGRCKGGLLLYKTQREIEKEREIERENEREITVTKTAHIAKGESR